MVGGRGGSVRGFARIACLAIGFGMAQPAAAADLRIGLSAEPTAMDPHYHTLSPNIAMHQHIFEQLIQTDARQKLVPGLAESWKVLADGKTWEIKLRQNVKWHDGTPFTADDVLFTFDRVPKVPNSPASFGYATKGKTLTKIDDHTIQMTTGSPSPLLPNDVSAIFIVSKKHGDGATTADYNSGKAAVGTGPYTFTDYVPSDRITVSRFEGYWGKKAAFDKVTFKAIKAGPARVAALLAGDVDLIEDVPTADIEKLRKEPKVALAQTPSNRSIFFHMDHFRDETPFAKAKDGSAIKNPFRDKRVRQALTKAINREAIVARVMEGAATPAAQWLPDGYFGIAPGLKPVAYDPEGAKKLLAEAGFPAGFKLAIHGPNGRYVNDVKIIEAVAQMLTRVGIETTIETLPPGPFFTRASAGAPGGLPEFSMTLLGWSPSSGENSGSLKPQLMTFNADKGWGTANRGRYSNPAFDAIVDEAVQTVDDGRRGELLAKATTMAVEEVAWLPLHYQINTWATKASLKIEPRSDEETFAMSVTGTP